MSKKLKFPDTVITRIIKEVMRKEFLDQAKELRKVSPRHECLKSLQKENWNNRFTAIWQQIDPRFQFHILQGIKQLTLGTGPSGIPWEKLKQSARMREIQSLVDALYITYAETKAQAEKERSRLSDKEVH